MNSIAISNNREQRKGEPGETVFKILYLTRTIQHWQVYSYNKEKVELEQFWFFKSGWFWLKTVILFLFIVGLLIVF